MVGMVGMIGMVGMVGVARKAAIYTVRIQPTPAMKLQFKATKSLLHDSAISRKL
jgi:hypothetical protein